MYGHLIARICCFDPSLGEVGENPDTQFLRMQKLYSLGKLQSQAEPWTYNLPVREGDTPFDPLLADVFQATPSHVYCGQQPAGPALPGAKNAI